MEMAARDPRPDAKPDGSERDGLVKHNGGDAEIAVPLSHAGKRLSPIEGDDLYRLRDRKFLLEDKKRLCAWALGTAVLGILLMVLHAELCPAVYQPRSIYPLTINCLISLSTGCLLIFIIAFHYKDVRLFIIDHNQVDWRIAMTSNRVLGIVLELIVCAIHPIVTYWEPGVEDKGITFVGRTGNNFSAPLCLSASHGDALLDTELLLSALMFLRLYLVHRTILLHSKVLMNKYPGRTLLVFILFFWLIASWMLTLCERQVQEKTGNMDTALWLTAITFLTVGYGDVSPQTSCGRVVCLFTGVMGVACTAMLVAVMTKKLALNKGEKHVHFFMMDIQISKRIRHAAANVLRECWLLHRTNMTKCDSGEHRHHQRCLLEAIRVFRHLRLKQRKLRDYASEMVDLPKMQMIMCDLSANWNNSYRELEQRIISMEQKLDELNRCFQHSSELLAQVVRIRGLDHR
ncbi:intermediate conductance calcium-activated potassium channel protein 4 isoform X2 [Denticeps clupeoides]|uniref:intermediate conductance calcium-activated potassium channel protein 4 isoform X2 n=1 Tax=Denticeps clupeoides TaxID=299321 RepID=UPI0010A2E1E5|nr:intermediate conductance calcium-activated potassium channel protein 4-like isoform X2 [Denticeps clupeoides]